MRRTRWLMGGVAAAQAIVGLPLVGMAQQARPPATYASLVRAANNPLVVPRALALSPDGRWLASLSYDRPDSAANWAAEVTVFATAGHDSSVVPLSGCSSALSWAPTGDLLALNCRQTIYLWRHSADRVDTVAAAPAYGSIEVLTWQSADRLVYTTTGPRTPRSPSQVRSRRATGSAGVRAPQATSTDSSCAAIGIGRYTVPVLCSDSVDVLRSRAREQPGNGRPSTSRRSAEADSTVTKVVVFDIEAGTHTVVAIIRGRPRDLVPMPDGDGVLVLVEGARSSNSTENRRPSRHLYAVRFSSSEGRAAPPAVLADTGVPATIDPRVVRVLADESVTEDRAIAAAPDGGTVAYLTSWYPRNGQTWEDLVEDTVYLAPVVPNAVPVPIALNLTPEVEGDPHRALQWHFTGGPSTTTRAPGWTPDGTRLVVVSHGQLWRLDAETRQAHRLSEGLGRRVTEVLWVSDREALVATYDPLAGQSGVWWVTLATGEWHRGYEEPRAVSHVVAAPSRSGRPSAVVYVGSTLRTPPNLYAVRLGPEGRRLGPPRQLTHHAVSVSLPATRDTLIAYQLAPDQWGTAFLLRPTGATLPVPTIVVGYPGSVSASRGARQFGLDNYEYVDYFAAIARGYAVLVVDIPLPPFGEYGERGPARAIVHAVTTALDAAARTGWVDTTKLGVIGHSGGGWMVNLLITRTQRFHAAVSYAGIADLVSFASGGTAYRPDFFNHGYMRMGEWIQDAPERYVQNSPILSLDSVTTPLLLIHGTRDPIVHISQAEEMFRGLAWRGKVVELVRYHGAGHGCGLLECRFRGAPWARAADWFDEYLRPERPPAEPAAQSPTAME